MKLPSEFEARTLEWMGEETYRALEAALQTVSVSIVRSGVGKLQENRYFGHPQGSIYRNDRLLHSIRCFMLVAIMCKKRLPCLWNRYYALILPGLW